MLILFLVPLCAFLWLSPTAIVVEGIRRDSNPYLLVHSQVCSCRYTTDTMEMTNGRMTNAECFRFISHSAIRHSSFAQQPDQDSNLEHLVRSEG
jgi:hypothetical protein